MAVLNPAPASKLAWFAQHLRRWFLRGPQRVLLGHNQEAADEVRWSNALSGPLPS